MSSSAGIQNLLVNVFRPVYTYDSNTGVFTPTLQLANVAYSGTTISISNVAVGDGNQNVYVGSNAGNSYLDLRGSDNNTALGFSAGGLISNVSNSVYLGYNAGNEASNASNVIAIGSNTGGNGINNIFLGSDTGSTGSNNILIGHSLAGVASNNLLRIGSSIYGDLATRWVGIGTPTPTSGSAFDVSGVMTASTVRTTNGTVAAPAYSFTSDPSLGIYRAGANQLGFASAGVQRMVISNSNVGIGTSAPVTTLDVRDPSGTIRVTDIGGAANPGIELSRSAGATFGSTGITDWRMQTGGANYQLIYSRNNAPVTPFLVTSTNGGQVGIGTVTPQTILDVSGRTRIVADGSSSLGSWGLLNNGTDTLILQHTGTYGSDASSAALSIGKSASLLFANGTENFPQARVVSEMTSAWPSGFSANLLFQTTQGAGLAERMRIHSNGFVGIGTPTPTRTLEVSGNAHISGILSAGAFDISSGAIASSNLVISGYLRNAVTPSQFDISGGNISNSGILTTNTVRTTNGTAAAPSYSFVSDPSLGVYRAGANQLGFAAAGVQRMVLSNGNVGIGANPPLSALDLGGVGDYITVNRLGNIPSTTDVSMIVEGSVGVGMYIQKGSNNNNCGVSFKTLSNAGFAERLRIDANTGNVGIRTTAPLTLLDVSGRTRILVDGSSSLTSWGLNNGTDTLILQHSGSYGTAADLGKSASILFTSATSNGPQARIVSEMTSTGAYSANLIFQTNGQGASLAERMRIHSNGNIGIGQPVPTTALDVSGSFEVASGNALFDVDGAWGNYANVTMNGYFNIYRSGTTNKAPSNVLVSLSPEPGSAHYLLSNNVGIRTSAPAYALDVSGTIFSRNNNLIVSNVTAQNYLGYLMSNNTGNNWNVAMYNSTGGGNGAAWAGALVFAYNGGARAYLDPSGNFGLGNPGAMPSFTLDVTGTTRTTTLLASGGIRNALIPTTFDISGGNISNSATLITSNIRAGAPGNTAVTAIQEFGRGSDALVAGFPAIAFQYRDSGGGYRHFIRTRHDSGGATSGNAIDFFTNTNASPTGSTAPFTGNTLAMAVTSAGVGIGTPTPVTVLDVSGRALIVADGSSSLTNYGVGVDTLVLQQRGSYINTADLGKSTSILFSNAYAGFPQARIVSEMTGVSNGAYGANLIFQTNAQSGNLAERMRIHSNGNIGIGRPVPTTRLDVSGTFQVTDRNAYFEVTPAIGDYGNLLMNGYFNIYPPGTTVKTNQAVRLSPEPGSFHFLMNNNVGIRTRDPSYALDVIGTTRATSFIGNGTIPVGGIIMWSGTIGQISGLGGWALCDGNNGTPNLTDRFVVGAGGTYSPTNTGGASNVTLTVSNVPPHRHTSAQFYTNGDNGSAISYYGGGSTTPSQNGSIYNAVNTLITAEGSAPTAVNILNPYFALAYIMRIS